MHSAKAEMPDFALHPLKSLHLGEDDLLKKNYNKQHEENAMYNKQSLAPL